MSARLAPSRSSRHGLVESPYCRSSLPDCPGIGAMYLQRRTERCHRDCSWRHTGLWHLHQRASSGFVIGSRHDTERTLPPDRHALVRPPVAWSLHDFHARSAIRNRSRHSSHAVKRWSRSCATQYRIRHFWHRSSFMSPPGRLSSRLFGGSARAAPRHLSLTLHGTRTLIPLKQARSQYD